MKTIRNVALVIFFFFLLSSFVKNFLDYQNKKAFHDNYKNQYEEEKKRQLELKTELLKKSDLNEVEKIIRNKLGLLKPGEVAVILPQPTPSPVIVTPTPKPNWQQWVDLYIKNI